MPRGHRCLLAIRRRGKADASMARADADASFQLMCCLRHALPLCLAFISDRLVFIFPLRHAQPIILDGILYHVAAELA